MRAQIVGFLDLIELVSMRERVLALQNVDVGSTDRGRCDAEQNIGGADFRDWPILKLDSAWRDKDRCFHRRPTCPLLLARFSCGLGQHGPALRPGILSPLNCSRVMSPTRVANSAFDR